MSSDLQGRIGHEFGRPDLLRVALTHRSYHFEHKQKSLGHFERLEFLGDAVLDLLMSELLMDRFPEVEEGTLSKWRASLVNEQSLGEIARGLKLGKHLYLGRSEELQQGRERARLLASAYEALLAAVYLDAGLSAVKSIVEKHFAARLGELNAAEGFKADFKTRLQEWSQKKHHVTPEYRLVSADGPEHAKRFRFEVRVGETVLGHGEGGSRKSAEQDAAQHALEQLTGVHA